MCGESKNSYLGRTAVASEIWQALHLDSEAWSLVEKKNPTGTQLKNSGADCRELSVFWGTASFFSLVRQPRMKRGGRRKACAAGTATLFHRQSCISPSLIANKAFASSAAGSCVEKATLTPITKFPPQTRGLVRKGKKALQLGTALAARYPTHSLTLAQASQTPLASSPRARPLERRAHHTCMRAGGR